MTRALLLVVVILAVCSGVVSAQTLSMSFSYQGKLTGSDGQPVADGSHSVTFRLYNAETGGTALWAGTNTVQTQGGVFSAVVGPVLNSIFMANDDCWLELAVDGATLSPRTRLLAVPYAGRAFSADTAQFADTVGVGAVGSSQLADNSVTSAKIADGAILLSDIGANGASVGQVIKRGPSGWVLAQDNDTIYMAGSGIYISGGIISIPEGGIGAYQLGATGASAGDVLSYDGTSLVWTAVGSGFSLPYSGSISSTDTAFHVANTGAGYAARFDGYVLVNGQLLTDTDIRSPRFFDSNNTAYYLDPASASYLNDVRASVFYDRNDTSYYVDPASSSKLNNLNVSGDVNAPSLDSRFLRKDTNAYDVQVLYGDIDLRSSSGASYLHPNATNANNWSCIASQVFNSPNYYGPDSTSTIYVGESSNTVDIRGTLQSPRLYDSNNTSYYVDPAGTSHVNDLRANIVYDRSDTSYYIDPSRSSRVNDLEVSGSLSVGSTPVRSPIAYGYISASGTVYKGTGNIACTWNSSYNRYEITITGEDYFYTNYVTTVTPNGGPRLVSVSSGSGKMLVTIYDLSGNQVQSNFQFVTYKP